MKVETIKPHNNGYGDKYKKAKDDVYDLPDVAAQTLVSSRLVAEVKEDEESAPAKGSAKPGGKPSGDAK